MIWVLTPKTGKPGHVQPAEIAEAAPTAGLMPTSSVNLGDWSRQPAGANRSRRPPAALMLPVGSTAPDFTLHDQNRQPVTLSDFRGAKDVLLVFFPLAFTGICQGELDEIRDHLPEYENDDRAVLAISVGPAPTHKVWATQSGFLFPVLVGFLAARRRQPGLRRVQRRRRRLQPRHVRRSTGPGSIRFAEMKQPGEARDQRLWVDALAALNA